MDNKKEFATIGCEENKKEKIFDFSMKEKYDEKNERLVILGKYGEFAGTHLVCVNEYGELVRVTRDKDNPISMLESLSYKLLNILEVEGLVNNPSNKFNYHTENSSYNLINKIGKLDQSLLDDFIDNPENIFGTGKYVSKKRTLQLESSLLFIKVTDFLLYTNSVDKSGYKLWSKFKYNNKTYTDLPIIDATLEKRLEKFSFPYVGISDEVYLTISIGKLIKGYAYKCIVGVIIPKL